MNKIDIVSLSFKNHHCEAQNWRAERDGESEVPVERERARVLDNKETYFPSNLRSTRYNLLCTV